MRPQRKKKFVPGNKGRHSSYLIGGSDAWPEKGNIHMKNPTPIRMQRLTKVLGLSTSKIAAKIFRENGLPISRSTISLTLNHGYIPTRDISNYKEQVEACLREAGATDADIDTCWDFESSDKVIPIGTRADSKHIEHRSPTDKFSETIKEAEMLTPTTKRHFQLFRDPFINEVREGGDVFMSESHRYAYAAMVDAARSGGFVAICGECGAGKSVMRRKLVAELNEAGDVRIIQPQTIDKSELTSGHILDSILLDLDPNATPRRTKEAKARQVRSALLESSRAGQLHLLIIEEAHDLSVATMKQLKRLWEIEDGYRKVLGIVLIGQTELQHRLNRNTHPEMREVILRCLIATLDAMGRKDCEAYIALKMERVGKKLEEIMDGTAIDAIMGRLTSSNGYSAVHPLYINNQLAKAMNMAAEIGEPLVTAEIIEKV